MSASVLARFLTYPPRSIATDALRASASPVPPRQASAFVPVRTLPWWLRGFADNQPATPVTETIRGLLLRQPVGTHLGVALAWCAGLLAVSVTVSAVAFRRRTA